MQRARLVVACLAAAISGLHTAAAAEEPEPVLPMGRSLGIDAPAAGSAAPSLAGLIPEIGIAGDPVIGDSAAPVTVVEFIDYECPYCQGFAKDTFPRLKANYIDTGKIRYVARDFPLPKHKTARPAAIAVTCAGEQGRFWQMREALLTAGTVLTDEFIGTTAKKLGLDMTRLAACRADPRHGKRLDADVAAAGQLGVGGTPSFLVGASAGSVARGRLLQGDEDYAAFEKILAAYLPTPP
jgi:protein-disulfide isomerase